MDYFFQEQRWTDTFLSLHVKKFKRIILFLLIAFSAAGTKAQSDVKFNDYVRYSQWVIDSRLGDFYGNTNDFGFTTYNRDLTVKKNVTKWKNGSTNPYIDYVPGLVAKATIEAAEYYKNFDWAKPWFKSVEWYGNKCTVPTEPDNLDAINASKMYFGIYALANGSFSSNAESTTASKATTQLGNALSALKHYNETYAFTTGTTLNSKAIAGGWYHKSTYQKQMWLDGQYMGPALLAQLINGYSSYKNNKVSEDDWSLITKQFTIVWDQCWDSENELLYHAFSSEQLNYWTSDAEIWTKAQDVETKWTKMTAPGHSAAFWGRAEGWYFLALVDVLEQMQIAGLNQSTNAQNNCYNTLKGYLDKLALGIAKRQNEESGCWYQLIGKDGNYSARYYNGGDKGEIKNYLESSCTAIFAAAFLKATRLGLLSSATDGTKTYNYKDIGTNAYKGAVTQFMKQRSDGTVDLLGCCKSAGLGTNALGHEKFRDGSNAYYLHGYDVAPTSTTSNNYTEGKVLGAFIMAATEYEREYQHSTLLSKDLNKTYNLSSNQSLTVEVLGDGTPEYQWYNATESTPSVITGANGSSYTPTQSGKYYCEITVTPPSATAKTREASTSGSYTITTSIAEVTVAAAATTYTVTFNAGSNGTCSESPKQVSAGENITLPSVTANSGYTFDGWWTAETGGTKIGVADDTYAPESNITLYARYSATGGSGTVIYQYTIKNNETNKETAYSATGGKATFGAEKVEDGKGFKSDKGMGSTRYIKIDLTGNTLQAGDDIIIKAYSTSNGGGIYIAKATAANSDYVDAGNLSAKNTVEELKYTVTETDVLHGLSTIYLFRNGATSDKGTSTYIQEITITRNGSSTETSGYTITYNLNGYGEAIENATKATALPNPLPKPSADGYTFVGWYTDSELNTAATAGAALTSDVTLYAKWRSITDLFTLTGVTSTTVSVSSKATVEVSSENATITGGSADLYNGHSSAKDMILSKQINLNGSSSSYLKITLDNSLKVGDEIIINPAASSFKLSAKDSNKDAVSFTGNYVIQEKDAVVGKNVIYLYKGSNSLITDVNITRYYPESDSRATFTYNNAEIAFSEKTAGDKSAYTTTLEIGASKKGESITITPSTKVAGATIKQGESTVSGNISIIVPSEIGLTATSTYTVTSKDGTSTTTYEINVKLVKENVVLVYAQSNGKTEWIWDKNKDSSQPTFEQPTLKVYLANADGTKSDKEVTNVAGIIYKSDVEDVAIFDENEKDEKIKIKENANGGAKIYAILKDNDYYNDAQTFFNILVKQGYSYSVADDETIKNGPSLNQSVYIKKVETKGETNVETNLVKMTFGGWKWNTFEDDKDNNKVKSTYVINGSTKKDEWNARSTSDESMIASIDGYKTSISGATDAVDESKEASEDVIYGSTRYGWFKPAKTRDDGYLETYPYSLPVRGAYMTFEPTQNGTLTVYILQNGAWNTNRSGEYQGINFNDGEIVAGEFRPHSFYICNQRGLNVDQFSPNTFTCTTKQKVQGKYYCDRTTSDKQNDPYNIATWTEFKGYMSAGEQERVAANWKSGINGAQKIVKLDNGSYLAIQKGIVKYSFFVTANETYYLFSNFSKLGFCGANFVPSKTVKPTNDVDHNITLSDVSAYPTPKKETGNTDDDKNKYAWKFGDDIKGYVKGFTIPLFNSITLNRTFKKDQWTTLSLPFNLTQTEVEQIFGKGTQIIVFDKAETTPARTNLTFFYHEIQNVLPGYPYLIRPTLKYDTNNSNSAVNAPTHTISADGKELTAFTVYNKAINPAIEQHEFVSDDYTAKCTPSYCTADVSGNNKSNYSKQYEKGDIFVSEGDGTVYISEGNSYGKGYRSYIDYTGTTPPSAKALSISFSGVEDGDDNGTTTDIRIAELADDVIQTLGIGGVYNLNGQKVADTTRNLPAGIYIVNGRKVVVK